MYYVNSYGDVQKPGYITALHFKMLTLLMLWYQTACISARGSKKHSLSVVQLRTQGQSLQHLNS